MSDIYKEIFKELENEVSRMEVNVSKSVSPVSSALVIYCFSFTIVILLTLLGISPKFITSENEYDERVISSGKTFLFTTLFSLIGWAVIYYLVAKKV